MPQQLDGVVDELQVIPSADAPAAMLLVHVSDETVVYANPVARQLAPDLALPTSVDAWSMAASLRDLDATGDLSDTTHPLSRVARSLPVGGQAVTAARATELGPVRQPLWVIGLPMTGAPGLDGHALVVLLPLRQRSALTQAGHSADSAAQFRVRERAVLATGMSFTVADAQAPDCPLIWVNPAFTLTTGYTEAEAVGRNCRFLQGPGTDPAQVAALRAGLDGGHDVTVTLLNYRKDGSAFWNQCTLSPIYDPGGVLTHYVGVQADVTVRVTADDERDRAVAAERAAHDHLALLAEASVQLAGTLQVGEALDRLAGLLVPLAADWVFLAGADDHAGLGGAVLRHRGAHQDLLASWAALVQVQTSADEPIRRLLDGGPAWLAVDNSDSPGADWGSHPAVLALREQLAGGSALFVPLPGHRQTVGAMVLGRGPGRLPHTEADLTLAIDLGRRAGLSLDNARLYQAEHLIAETLQRSLLPALPSIAGVSAAARYRASADTAHIGGDFYDLLDLPDGAVGVAIGDVVGHDLLAAAAMGHLRGLLRACAWDVEQHDGRPSAVLDRVDRLLQGLHATSMATLAYARLEPPGHGGTKGLEDVDAATDRWRLQYSSAGHPPLLLRHPDGHVEVLDQADGLLLGVQSSTRATAELTVARGSTLLAYTDGVVERRAEHLDTGIRWLADLLRDSAASAVEDLCDQTLTQLGDSEDDVALLAVHLR